MHLNTENLVVNALQKKEHVVSLNNISYELKERVLENKRVLDFI